MADAHAIPAHQFDDIEQQRESASLGMWTFLATEVLFFGGLFLSYIVFRYLYPNEFAAGSRQLLMPLGATNTAVLLTSSWTMALAVRSAQLGNRRALFAFLFFTVVLGASFLGIKLYEWSIEIHDGFVPGPEFSFAPMQGITPAKVEIFFFLYFAMTGLHALHMIIGIGVLLALMYMAGRGRFSERHYSPVEMAGLYWHFVDIIWIFLFPMLYLVGHHKI